MTDGGEHEDYDALAVAWAIDALDTEDRDRFEHHLIGGCPRCAGNLQGALDVAAELAHALPQLPPTTALRLRVLAVAAQNPASFTSSRRLAGVTHNSGEQGGTTPGRQRRHHPQDGRRLAFLSATA